MKLTGTTQAISQPSKQHILPLGQGLSTLHTGTTDGGGHSSVSFAVGIGHSLIGIPPPPPGDKPVTPAGPGGPGRPRRPLAPRRPGAPGRPTSP